MGKAWPINEDAGAPEYSAQELRRIAAMHLFPGVSDRFGARQGVRPHSSAVVSVSGTTWTQHHLSAVVYPGLTGISGPYVVEKTEESDSLDPADGSNPRIDALDLQVRDDDEDASGERDARVVYVAGTPASDPNPPPVTPNSLRLATFDVPAGGSPSPSVRSLAPWTVATGGVLPVRDDDEYPTAGLYDGLTIFDQDLGDLLVRSGGQWRIPQRGWVPITIGEASSAGDILIDLTDDGRWPAGSFREIEITMNGNLDTSSELLIARVNNDSTSSLYRSGYKVKAFSDDGNVVSESNRVTNRWILGQWGNLSGSTMRMLIQRADGSSNLPFQAMLTTMASTRSLSTGRLESSRLVDSLWIGHDEGGVNFGSVRWQARGYLP